VSDDGLNLMMPSARSAWRRWAMVGRGGLVVCVVIVPTKLRRGCDAISRSAGTGGGRDRTRTGDLHL